MKGNHGEKGCGILMITFRGIEHQRASGRFGFFEILCFTLYEYMIYYIYITTQNMARCKKHKIMCCYRVYNSKDIILEVFRL